MFLNTWLSGEIFKKNAHAKICRVEIWRVKLQCNCTVRTKKIQLRLYRCDNYLELVPCHSLKPSSPVLNINFHPCALEVVSRYRDPQLQVDRNYSNLILDQTFKRSFRFSELWIKRLEKRIKNDYSRAQWVNLFTAGSTLDVRYIRQNLTYVDDSRAERATYL